MTSHKLLVHDVISIPLAVPSSNSTGNSRISDGKASPSVTMQSMTKPASSITLYEFSSNVTTTPTFKNAIQSHRYCTCRLFRLRAVTLFGDWVFQPESLH